MVSKLKQKEYLKSYFTALKGKMIPICSCIRITNACNMSCDYCSVVKDNKNDISISKWKKVVDTLYKLGNREINITGGEPLLRKDLFELVSYISKKNIIVSVSTNGTLLNNENIKELNNSGLDYMSISVDTLKIDGYKYGKQFSDVEEILKNISKRKLNFKVEITPVINRNNFTEMPSLVKKFSKMGFDIRFMLMMPNLTYPQKDVKLRFKKSDIKKFEIVIKKLKKLEKELEEQTHTFCFRDYLPSNCLFDEKKNKIVYTDLERASFSVPTDDISCLLLHSPENANTIIKSYQKNLEEDVVKIDDIEKKVDLSMIEKGLEVSSFFSNNQDAGYISEGERKRIVVKYLNLALDRAVKQELIKI